MKTSTTSFLRKGLITIFYVVISSLTISSVKAQCGFSLNIPDTLVFLTNPGVMDTEKITITNTSSGSLSLSLRIPSVSPFLFRVLDSQKTILPGNSITVSIRFQPSIGISGSNFGKYVITNNSTKCRDTIILMGIVKRNLCLETIHGLSYKDPVVIGSTAEHQFHLINQSGSNIVITNVTLEDSVSSGFKITSQLPLIVPPFSSDKLLTYTFSPTSNYANTFFSTTFATMNLSGDSVGCSSLIQLLIGNVANPSGISGIDTDIRPIFPDESRTLAITGSDLSATQKFTFTNNLNVICSVNKVYMKDNSYFHVASTDPTPTPFILNRIKR